MTCTKVLEEWPRHDTMPPGRIVAEINNHGEFTIREEEYLDGEWRTARDPLSMTLSAAGTAALAAFLRGES